MPTVLNAINNAIDTLGWIHTTVGVRRKNSSRCSNWRSEVETLIKANGWLWKTDAGNGYDAFVLQYVGLDDCPVFGASLIRRTPKTDDTKPAYKAINELILNCFKKVRESRNKRKRAVAQEELRAEAGNIAEDEEADASGQQAK